MMKISCHSTPPHLGWEPSLCPVYAHCILHPPISHLVANLVIIPKMSQYYGAFAQITLILLNNSPWAQDECSHVKEKLQIASFRWEGDKQPRSLLYLWYNVSHQISSTDSSGFSLCFALSALSDSPIPSRLQDDWGLLASLLGLQEKRGNALPSGLFELNTVHGG